MYASKLLRASALSLADFSVVSHAVRDALTRRRYKNDINDDDDGGKRLSDCMTQAALFSEFAVQRAQMST
jgi:hypothetical protein